MATHGDNLITRKQAARLLGCTARTLTRYASREDDPLLPERSGGRGKPALYDPRTVADWHLRQELARLAEAAGHDGDAIDYQAERARLTRAQADREEIKVQALRRQVADVRLITFSAANFGAQASAVFETLPGKIKRLRPELTHSDIQAIRAEVVKVQNLAADIQIDWSEAPEIE